jgi:hypothetical protein
MYDATCDDLISSSCLDKAATLAKCAQQQMRTDLAQFGLNGNVERVETNIIVKTTESYKLLPGGSREVLREFGNPAELPPDSARLTTFRKFNREGRLVEDIDVTRPVVDQKPYRYVYSYDPKGILSEKTGYREDGSLQEKTEYISGPKAKKAEKLFYSIDGKLQAKHKFDEHENVVSIMFYGDDGHISMTEMHRYEYQSKGSTMEQIYFEPKPPAGSGIIVHPPITPGAQKPSPAVVVNQWMTQFVYDDAGRVREENRFYPGGSLLEKKVFDERGILRAREFRAGDMYIDVSTFDAEGKEVESHMTAKKGFVSSHEVDYRRSFTYDPHGNLSKMITTGPDGSLIGGTTNVFEYDDQWNWIKKIEAVLNNTWQTEPFSAGSETITEYRRSITYFKNK